MRTKDEISKKKILALMEKELNEKIPFIPRERISELIEKFQESRLSYNEKREITDRILANYIDENNENGVEDLIDWLLTGR